MSTRTQQPFSAPEHPSTDSSTDDPSANSPATDLVLLPPSPPLSSDNSVGDPLTTYQPLSPQTLNNIDDLVPPPGEATFGDGWSTEEGNGNQNIETRDATVKEVSGIAAVDERIRNDVREEFPEATR